MNTATLLPPALCSILALTLCGSAHAMGVPSLSGLEYDATACGEAQPDVLSVDYAASPGVPGEVLVRGDIVYATGDAIDVTLSIPLCTHVAGVTVDGLALGEGYDPIEGTSRYYEVVSTSDVLTATLVVIRVFTANLGQGYSPEVVVDVASFGGTLQDSHRFTIGQVASIGSTVPLTFTDEQLMNMLVAGAYDDFGDADAWEKCGADGSCRTYYDLDYDALDIHVEADGIHVAYAFEAEVDDWCDAHVSLDGVFHLESHFTDGIVVVWDEGGEASFDSSWICDWTTLGIADGILEWLEADDAGDSFEAQIESAIGDAVGDADCGDFSCGAFIRQIDHVDGEVVVHFDPPYQTVTLEVPYDVDRLDDVDGTGLALAAGERVAVLAGGAMEACTDDLGFVGTCPTHTVTPTGLFEWHTDAPVPADDDWSQDNLWIPHPERVAARDELSGFDRDVAQVRVADEAIGRLLGTTWNRDPAVGHLDQTVFDVGSPCGVDIGGTLGSGFAHAFTFAPNDQEAQDGSDLGSGSYQVSIGFESEQVPDLPDCDVVAVESLTSAAGGAGQQSLP